MNSAGILSGREASPGPQSILGGALELTGWPGQSGPRRTKLLTPGTGGSNLCVLGHHLTLPLPAFLGVCKQRGSCCLSHHQLVLAGTEKYFAPSCM